MTQKLETSLVRIQTPQGVPVGSGFLVADRVALTCAHVVASALGLQAAPADAPPEAVLLDFPRASRAPPA